MPSSSYQMDPAVYAELKKIAGNDVCCNCSSRDTDWGCVKTGVLFCTECSGKHRGLGTHISFVRSVKMDSWTDEQLAIMKLGGNRAFHSYLRDNHQGKSLVKSSPISAKFDNPTTQLYQLQLKARARGEPVPTKLPPPRKKQTTNGTSKYQGFGSSTPNAATKPNSNSAGLIAAGVAVVAAIAFLMLRS